MTRNKEATSIIAAVAIIKTIITQWRREALAKVADVAAYLVSNNEPELGVALGFPVNAAELCKELTELGAKERESKC